MSTDEREKALVEFGFTDRQARFLLAVMLHAGVCLGRQYCTHAGIARGQKMHDFFSSLLKRRLATRYSIAHRSRHIYHVQGKALYRAIGETDNRNRKPVTLSRAIERLMLLDVVLAHPQMRWLGTESDKRSYFEPLTALRPNELPHLRFGSPPAQTVRYFPDKLPIGITPDGRTHLLLYVATQETPADFRAFLHRHAELLRALASWELRILVPRHLAKVSRWFEAAAREELARPLSPDTIKTLQEYFRQRQRLETGSRADGQQEFERLEKRFGAPRFRALYRTWKDDGDAVVFGTASPVLRDLLARDYAVVSTHIPSHKYQDLAPLVGTA